MKTYNMSLQVDSFHITPPNQDYYQANAVQNFEPYTSVLTFNNKIAT